MKILSSLWSSRRTITNFSRFFAFLSPATSPWRHKNAADTDFSPRYPPPHISRQIPHTGKTGYCKPQRSLWQRCPYCYLVDSSTGAIVWVVKRWWRRKDGEEKRRKRWNRKKGNKEKNYFIFPKNKMKKNLKMKRKKMMKKKGKRGKRRSNNNKNNKESLKQMTWYELNQRNKLKVLYLYSCRECFRWILFPKDKLGDWICSS